MDAQVPTMQLRYFEPSAQLTGNSSAARESHRLNSNYRGDHSLSVNRGDEVPDHKNCCLWITGLPPSITVRGLLSTIKKTGRIRSTVINPATESSQTAAASISFFKRSDAETLFKNIQRGDIVIGGRFPRVFWNRNKVAEEEGLSAASRVLIIAGDADVVNADYLDRFFSSKFVYELDEVIDHGTVDSESGPIARLEYRFGSWRSQAAFARLALSLELRGFLLTEYAPDPWYANVSPWKYSLKAEIMEDYTTNPRITSTEILLRGFFGQDSLQQFQLERFVGSGSFALAWKLKIRPPANGSPSNSDDPPTYFVLKTAKSNWFFRRGSDGYDGGRVALSSDDDEIDSIKREKNWLTQLQWAKHICKILEPISDPLEAASIQIRQQHWPQWAYLEWLDNGTVMNLIRRSLRVGIRVLPNRMLWQIFLCLVRACCAMAWPPPQPDGPYPAPVTETVGSEETASNLRHSDLHEQNVLFGPILLHPPEQPEHQFMPILKVIDFGAAKLIDTDEVLAELSPDELPLRVNPGVSDNVFDIGMLMCAIIMLDEDVSDNISPERHERVPCHTVNNVEFLTAAVELLAVRPVDGLEQYTKLQVRQHARQFWALDEYLVRLVCQCTAIKRNDRPSLAELVPLVEDAIARRGYDFHKTWEEEDDPWDKMSYDSTRESDQYIQQTIATLFLDADARKEAVNVSETEDSDVSSA
ncbi:hypothetical protein F5Y04DRAFT_293090 [Hypomontagnella monticulosa]|nr:hypothetical protein F5Y04DRAFT_293090 [Hypomontagnella monticulosa]